MKHEVMKVCILYVPPVMTHTMAGSVCKDFNEDLVKRIFVIHVSTLECFCHQLFIILERRLVGQLRNARDFGFCICYDLACHLLLQKKSIAAE